MINCQEATKLCSMQVEEKIGLVDSLKLKLHLLLCKPCYFFAKQIKIMHHSLKSLSKNGFVAFSDQKKHNIQEQINKNLKDL